MLEKDLKHRKTKKKTIQTKINLVFDLWAVRFWKCMLISLNSVVILSLFYVVLIKTFFTYFLAMSLEMCWLIETLVTSNFMFCLLFNV